MHFVGAAFALDDDLRVADHRLELEDAPFDEGLLLLGVLVLRVFRNVAEFFGLPNSIVHLFAVDGFQFVKLGLELAQPILGEEYFLFGH